jgi:hypothetical protein
MRLKCQKIIFSGLVAAFFLSASVANAACVVSGLGPTCGEATTYQVQVSQVELCTGTSGTDCQNAAVIGSGTQSFDIADAAVGAEIGSYGTLDNLVQGTTYTHIKMTLSTSFNVQGAVAGIAGVGGDCNTPAGGIGTTADDLDGVAAGGPLGTSTLAVPAVGILDGTNPTAAFYAGIGLVHNGATMTIVIALDNSVTITTTMPSVDIAFRVEEGLAAYNDGTNNCAFFPQPPEVSITVR